MISSEVFEPDTENQKRRQCKQLQQTEKQIQALHDSSQTTKQPIQSQTKAL